MPIIKLGRGELKEKQESQGKPETVTTLKVKT
jgi:hypothetical protein